MKNECSIVKDLIPLYIDDILSKDTVEFVEEHLQSCANCRKYLKTLTDMNEEIVINDKNDIDKGEVIKNMKKKMNMNKILTILLTFVGTVILIIVGLNYYLKPMDFTAKIKEIKKENMQIIVMESIDISTNKYINDSKVYSITVGDKEYNEIIDACKDYSYHRTITSSESMIHYYSPAEHIGYSAITIDHIVIEKDYVYIDGQKYKIDNVSELLSKLNETIQGWNIDYVHRQVTFDNHNIVDDVSETIVAK